MAQDFKITPWEVEGKIDYEKIFKMFGVQKFDENIKQKLKRKTGDLHLLFRRNVVFAHRDFEKALEKGFFLYTGRGPSGPMHIGHIIPFYLTKWLQEKFKVNVYIELTDDEKFLEPKRKLSFEETQKWTEENILDIISVGFDPDRTFIFKDTEYIRNMYPLALKVAKVINFSTVRAIFGFTNQTSIGMIFFPTLQIVPTFFEDKICLVPSSIDQDPYFRLQRDVAERLHRQRCATIYHKLLPGLLGIDCKMSSSKPETCVYLDEGEESIREKIYKYAFSGGQPTLELHRKLGGNPEIDVCFQWLYLFFEDDDKKIEEIEEEYRSGRMSTGELKEIAIQKITEFIREHRKKREKARKKVEKFMYKGKLAKKMWETVFE